MNKRLLLIRHNFSPEPTGTGKSNGEMMAENLKLDNLRFLPLQPFEKFNKFLGLVDLHLVIQKAIASDLVMPSKFTTPNEGIQRATREDFSFVNRNARKYAENLLSIDKIMPNFGQILSSGQRDKFQAIEADRNGGGGTKIRGAGTEAEQTGIGVGEEIPFQVGEILSNTSNRYFKIGQLALHLPAFA